jgi:predicted transcriptional regulator
MNTVILQVNSRKEWNQHIIQAFHGEPQQPTITFETPTLLFNVLSGKRWDLLQVMTGRGAMAIREVARCLGRDVKAVHSDIHKLLKTGILNKTEEGKVEFPFDELHVDFTLRAA